MSQFFWASKKARMEDPSAVGLGQLAFPLLMENLLRCTVGLVNVTFLSHISDSIVSAISVANQYIMVVQVLAMSISMGTITCLNQAIGMKNQHKMRTLSSIAFFSNLVLGLAAGAFFLLLSGPILSIMKLEPASIGYAKTYMQIAGGAIAVQSVEIVLSDLCRSMGRTKTPLMINLIVNLVNLSCCYLFIFQPIPIAIDPVVGVALANVLGRLAGLVIAAIIAARSGIRISARALKPFPMDDIKLALSIGIPGGMNNIAYMLCQLVTTSIISMSGEMMVTAKVYVSNLVQYIALVGMSFGSASALMIGYRIGAGKYDEAKTIRRIVTRVALLSNAFFSILLILVREPLMRIFTDNEAIIQIGMTIILIDFVVEIGRALNNSLSGALQAAGDVRYQLIVNQASGWLVSVGGSYLLGIALGLNLYGVWIAFAMDELVRGLLLLRRWRSDHWMLDAEHRRSILAKEA
ncbi:MAG: MATE family efflux transporter [Clostridia bacterium]|nr:MATE family efflux transporter [Clostridia bacterium]